MPRPLLASRVRSPYSERGGAGLGLPTRPTVTRDTDGLRALVSASEGSAARSTEPGSAAGDDLSAAVRPIASHAARAGPLGKRQRLNSPGQGQMGTQLQRALIAAPVAYSTID